MNRTDGEDSWFLGRQFAASDCLEREHDLRGEDNGVFGFVGHCAMSAQAFDRDVDAIGVCGGWAAGQSDGSRGDSVHVVEGEADIWAREIFEQPGFDHRERSCTEFFGGLRDEDEGAAPF